MMYLEVKSWVAKCDRCGRESETMFSIQRPLTPPEGWEFIAKNQEMDDMYYPSESYIMLCPLCLQSNNET